LPLLFASFLFPMLQGTHGVLIQRPSGCATNAGAYTGRVKISSVTQVRTVSGFALATSIMAVAAAAPARAEERVIAKVPFDFVAGEVRLPAGEYVVKVVSEDLTVWEVASADGRHSAMVNTIAASCSGRPEAPELVFNS
jgi:hypothetical protein